MKKLVVGAMSQNLKSTVSPIETFQKVYQFHGAKIFLSSAVLKYYKIREKPLYTSV
jgi:hypothetical protein